VRYGDKIAVEEVKHLVAGNAANNAVGSSRLGLKTAIYVNVGSDDSGFRIKKKLAEEKVDPRYIKVNEGMESNYSAVLNFQGERTIFVYHQQWEYHLPEMEPSKWVYYTSASASFSKTNFSNELASYVKKSGAKMGYNPGTYQIKAGVRNFPEILAVTDVFFVNVEEAKRILEIPEETSMNIKELLKKTRDELELKFVIITDGRDGSYGYDGTDAFKIGEFPGERVEATGAGDSYATAVCAAFFHGKTLPEAMLWGSINGASVVSKIGPQEGLLTREQIEERASAHPEIKAQKI
jgi:2-dehydro-3-deoxygluconokinase